MGLNFHSFVKFICSKECSSVPSGADGCFCYLMSHHIVMGRGIIVVFHNNLMREDCSGPYGAALGSLHPSHKLAQCRRTMSHSALGSSHAQNLLFVLI